MESAKLNDVEPLAWLSDVLERMSPPRPRSRPATLLPWNWKASKAVETPSSA